MENKFEGVNRNDECPCGSGRKYKRCHGLTLAEKSELAETATTAPKAPGFGGIPGMPNMGAANGANPFGDMDPQLMGQAMQALQKLPRQHLQKLQAIMQRAMAGQDVTREAMEFEKLLPPDVQQTLRTVQAAQMSKMGMGGMPGMAGMNGAPASNDISLDEAKRIVEEAAKAGKLSKEEAEKLLAGQTGTQDLSTNETKDTSGSDQKKGFWSRITGK